MGRRLARWRGIVTLLKVLAGFGANEDIGSGILNNPCNYRMLQRVLAESMRLFEKLGDADVYFPEADAASSVVSGMVVQTTTTATWVDGSPPTVATSAGSVNLPRRGRSDPNVRSGATLLYAVDDSGNKYCVSDYMDNKIGTIKMWDGSSSIPSGWQEFPGDGIIQFDLGYAAWTKLPQEDTGIYAKPGLSDGSGWVDPNIEEFTIVTGPLWTTEAPASGGTTKPAVPETDWVYSFPLGATDSTALTIPLKKANITLNEDTLKATMIGDIELLNTGTAHTHSIDSYGSGFARDPRGMSVETHETFNPTEGGNYDALGRHYHSVDTASHINLVHTPAEIIVGKHTHPIDPNPHSHDLTEPVGPEVDQYGHGHTVDIHTHPFVVDAHKHLVGFHTHKLGYSGHSHPLFGSLGSVSIPHAHSSGQAATYTVIPIERIH